MSRTYPFKPMTLTEHANFGGIAGCQLFGIDIGYGHVKVQSDKGRSVFPAFVCDVTSVQSQEIGKRAESFIRVEDHKTGKTYLVGEQAMNFTSDGISDARESLYSASRYNTEAYKVLIMSALGRCSMLSDAVPVSDRNIFIETGLPSNQMDKDQNDRKQAIIRAFAGDYDFTLTFGSSSPCRFTHTVFAENTDVVRQPSGTLYHLCVNDKYQFVPESYSRLMAPDSKVLMIDAGTKTVILTRIYQSAQSHIRTLDNCGMAMILKKTSDAIYADTGYRPTDIELQTSFGDGMLTIYDMDAFESTMIDIEPYLRKAVKDTFEEVVDLITKFVPDLGTYKVIILTGGTSAAWKGLFEKKFSKMKGISFIMGNLSYYHDGMGNYSNETMKIVFSNVSGYYKYLYMMKANGR